MSKPFNNLRKKMSAIAQEAASEKTQKLLEEMSLRKLQSPKDKFEKIDLNSNEVLQKNKK